MEIRNFNDFCAALQSAGFSMGGGNAHGVFAVIPFGWEEQDFLDTPVKWHTGDPETDPWEWRMRVLEERDDIAYGKFFFRTSGYITREWYPYFLAARREKRTLDGLSDAAKKIHTLVFDNAPLPMHVIRELGDFGKSDKAAFDRGITELQMRLLLTISGRAQKVNQNGEAYGWSSTVFTTPERFFGGEILAEAEKITAAQGEQKIAAQILKLNPEAKDRDIRRFILG